MKNDYIIHISQATIFTIIGYVALVWFSVAYTNIILIVLLSLVLASAIEPIKRKLHQFHIPSSLTVLGVFLVFFCTFAVLLWKIIPIVKEQYGEVRETFPDLIVKINSAIQRTFPEADTLNPVDVLSYIDFSNLGSIVQVSTSGVTAVFGSIAHILLILFLTFYFSTSTKGVNNVIKTFTPRKYKEYSANLWDRSKQKIGLWAKGQAIIGFILATLTFLGLVLIGVENAFLFSLIVLVFSFIPVLGPILSMIPPILFSLTLPEPVTMTLLVMGLYVLIQQFEGALLYPLIVNKLIGVPPALVLIALFIGGSIAGIIGALLAAPLVAVLQEVYLDIERGTVGKVTDTQKENQGKHDSKK